MDETEKLQRVGLARILDCAIDRQCGDHPRAGSSSEILAQLYTARAVLHLAEIVAEQQKQIEQLWDVLFPAPPMVIGQFLTGEQPPEEPGGGNGSG